MLENPDEMAPTFSWHDYVGKDEVNAEIWFLDNTKGGPRVLRFKNRVAVFLQGTPDQLA